MRADPRVGLAVGRRDEEKLRYWRRGYESNIPRPVRRADNGFEDRGGHQAPITLHNCRFPISNFRLSAIGNRQLAIGNGSAFGAHGFQDDIWFGELAGGELRVDLLSVDRHLEGSASRRHERQRA